MYKAIDIIDDFYTQEQLDILFDYTSKSYFRPSLQPHLFEKDYATRFQAYPCYESTEIMNGDYNNLPVYKILKDNLKSIGFNFDYLHTFFRKIYKSEIEKSVCSDGSGIRHKDGPEYDLGGVIYLDELSSFKSGTRFFTDERFKGGTQQEQDIQIGSKFNRAIIFDCQTSHQALYDLDIDSRFVQPFFIKNYAED